MDIRASLKQGPSGRWTAAVEGRPELRCSGASMERCLSNLQRSLDRAGLTSDRDRQSRPVTLVVQTIPVLAGVAEAAQVMGWDKRRVITYIDRGRFPEPFQTLASGRVWARADVEAYAREWHERRAAKLAARS